MNKWNSFKEKTVLVTGASSGIGYSMAEDLAKRGANLVLVARSRDKLETLASSIRKEGRQATAIALDLSTSDAAEKLYAETTKLGLKIDLLINNAGYGRWGAFDKYERADYNKMIQLNITTLTDLCYMYLPDMVQTRSGGIINVASVAAFGPVPFGNVYSATKSYVLMFTEALNYEYRDQGIHIMALCPGATESKFMEVATEKSAGVRAKAEKRAGSMNYIPSAVVAKDCLDSFLKGRIYRITGRNNRLMYGVGKLLSRRALLNFSGRMFGDIVNA